jgi:hypothetical protein
MDPQPQFVEGDVGGIDDAAHAGLLTLYSVGGYSLSMTGIGPVDKIQFDG